MSGGSSVCPEKEEEGDTYDRVVVVGVERAKEREGHIKSDCSEV